VEKPTSDQLLARAFEKAAERPLFIAGDLLLYGSLNGMAATSVSSYLNCTLNGFYRLGLCKKPDSLSPSFRSQVEKIAFYVGAHPQRLGSLLREADSVRAMQAVNPSQLSSPVAGFLMAARDKEAPANAADKPKKPSAKRKKAKKRK
jgi:hypothetical protein